MNYQAFLATLENAMAAHVITILGALAVLVIGWIVAILGSSGIRRLLVMIKVDQYIAESTGQHTKIEAAISIGVFWVILLITLVSVFNVLNLSVASNPFAELTAKVLGYLPNLVAGSALALLGWLIAIFLRRVVTKSKILVQWEDRLSSEAGLLPMSRYLGDALFCFVILLFMPAILDALRLNGLLIPVQMMVNKFLDVVPNLFAAMVIGLAGWLVAKILRGLVTNLLVAAGVDKAAEKAGCTRPEKISGFTGTIVFILVFVPILISALDTLKFDTISKPASEMLTQFLIAVPHIVAAAGILFVTFYIARFVATNVAQLLSSMGADEIPEKMGMEHIFSGMLKPSSLASSLLLFFAMLFAVVEAANRLDFLQVRDIVAQFIEFGMHIMLGGIVLIAGFWLATITRYMIAQASGGGETDSFLARIAHIAIMGLVLAIGLRAMGVANDIVRLAFALTLGSVAVAVALAFGLGGREAAGKQLEYWLSKLRKE